MLDHVIVLLSFTILIIFMFVFCQNHFHPPVGYKGVYALLYTPMYTVRSTYEVFFLYMSKVSGHSFSNKSVQAAKGNIRGNPCSLISHALSQK